MTSGSPIRIPWRSQLRNSKDAPRDGSRFYAIPKGKMTPARVVWDEEMGCYLSEDFACIDQLACWWPL